MTDSATGRVSLDITFQGGMVSPEEYTFRDALRWQFKQLGEPCEIPYSYCADNRLYANAPTRLPKPPVPSYKNWSFPDSKTDSSFSIADFVAVEILPSFIDPSIDRYGPPYVQEANGYYGPTGEATYAATVQFGSITCRLVVDTVSDISWVRGFPVENDDRRYNHTETTIPMSHFDVTYFDTSRAWGVVCKEEGVSFGLEDTQFKATWTFGAAIGSFCTPAISELTKGVLGLGLGLKHPSAKSEFSPPSDKLTFVETLIREGLIEDPYYCIRLDKRVIDFNPSNIVFGKLPDLGTDERFDFELVEGGYWALPSKYIAVIKAPGTGQEGERIQYNYSQHHQQAEGGRRGENFAMLDIGTEYIYLPSHATRWIYETLCGEDGYFPVQDGYYMTEGGLRCLERAYICIHIGKKEFCIPAEMLRGQYSQMYLATKGTVCSFGDGSILDDGNISRIYDIYGAAFLRYAWVAFDAQPAEPKVAIWTACSSASRE